MNIKLSEAAPILLLVITLALLSYVALKPYTPQVDGQFNCLYSYRGKIELLQGQIRIGADPEIIAKHNQYVDSYNACANRIPAKQVFPAGLPRQIEKISND